MKLSILIPFRDADNTRTPAKEWIVRRWAHFYPEAEIIVASDDGIDPFNKSMAVNAAARQATGDIYVVLDADTWAPMKWVKPGIDAVASGKAHWDIPCRKALRLKQDVSERIMAMDPSMPGPPRLLWSNRAQRAGPPGWPDEAAPGQPHMPDLSPRDAETHGPVVGFLWIVSRSSFEQIGGMDERIRGWGGEDTMFTWAMRVVNGHPLRGIGTLFSLWHLRPRDANDERIWPGQGNRAQTEQAKRDLAARYQQARNRAAMLKVLER